MKAVDIGQYLCVAVFLNEPGFALIKSGKICRHGNEGHKGRQFYSHRSLEAEARHPGHTRTYQTWSADRGSKGKTWAHGFIVVSARKNWQGRVNRFPTG